MSGRPFELPEFYVGWPARLNPSVERRARTPRRGRARWGSSTRRPRTTRPRSGARRSSTRWTTRCCARTRIRTRSAAELDLVTDWYVWVFYFDDHFLERLQAPARRGGRRARTSSGCRCSCRSTSRRPPPRADQPGRARPAGPVVPDGARARRASGAGGSSRARRTCSRSPTGSCNNINDGRVANPIEYIEMRRKVGGAPWSAHLVEHANFVEVPDRDRATPADARAQGHVRRRGAPAQRPLLLRARDRRGGRARQLRARARALLRHRHRRAPPT